MAASTELEQTQWLVDEARPLLAAYAGGQLPQGAKLAAWQLALLQQQIGLRHRSRMRFPDPERWLWSDKSLSQASDHWSAAYKASLFPSGVPVVDACCGAGADLVALAARGETLGIDLDPIMALLAISNAQAHGLQADVQAWQLPEQWPTEVPWLHIDPDRRFHGRRTLEADQFSPSLEAVLEMAATTRGTIVKLAPSTRVEPEVEQRIEQTMDRVWLGSMGECRQQLLLSGELRQLPPGERQAVLCEPQWEAGARVDALQPVIYSAPVITPPPPVDQPLGYLYELHSVLHAAELHSSWASHQGLQCLGGEHGYYTSSTPLDSPWMQRFEVLEVVAWDDRKVRKTLRQHQAGAVEVKCRLAKLDANAYQRRYTAADGQPLCLLVTRLGDRVRAIVARRAGA